MTTRARSIIVAVLAVALAGASAAIVAARQQARDNAPVPTGTASIAGTVWLAGDMKAPARKARVTLTNVAQSTPGQTATTDDNGAFMFTGLPAGRFEIRATKPGYLRASYGASRPERAGTPVVVKEGETVAGLTMTMARGGVITGTVRDQGGRPAANLSVRVLKIGYRALTGERTLGAPNAGATVMTDDRGVYRAYGLPPGGYLILADLDSLSTRSSGPYATDIRVLSSADLQKAMQAARFGGTTGARAAAPASTTAPRMDYAPVFHPGVTDIAAAGTVALGLSEERSGVDIAIQLAATATVRVTVTDPSGALPPMLSVNLFRAGPDVEMLAGAGIRGFSTSPTGPGQYQFAAVTPGLYTVKAAIGRGRGAAPNEPIKWAKADINVNGGDLDVPLELKPGIAINGRVVFEGGPPPDPADLQQLSFRLMPLGSGGQLMSSGGGRVDGDARFTFAGIAPDTYQFATSWTAPAASDRWTLKGSVVNGRDAYESPLTIAPDDRIDWTVTYTTTPTTLTGVFQDRSGHVATDYYLLVFSADRAFWTPGSRRVRTARPATDGAFVVKGVPAGEYYLAALTDLEPGEWNDPTLLERLIPTAARVVLREGQTTVQDFRVGG